VEVRQGKVEHCHLDRDAHFEELPWFDAEAIDVERHSFCDCFDAGFHDEESTAGAATHAGDLLVLEYAYCLAQDCPADFVTFDEFGLGAEERAYPPAIGRD